MISLNEKDFILSALESGQRIDGRGPFDYRKISAQFHQKRGQVEVSLGDTLVYSATSASLVEPYPDRPHEGFLNFQVEFLPMAHPHFENLIGPVSQKNKRIRNDISGEIERLLEKSLRRAKALNVESLSVVSGKHVWSITVNIHILTHSGNLVDACAIAAVISLLHMQVPDYKVLPDKSLEELPVYKPLSLHFLPISITLGLLPNSQVILDPLFKEELLLEGKVVVSMNVYGDILACQKTGGGSLSTELLMQCIEVARVKVKDITHLIRNSVSTAPLVEPQRVNLQRAQNLLEQVL